MQMEVGIGTMWPQVKECQWLGEAEHGFCPRDPEVLGFAPVSRASASGPLRVREHLSVALSPWPVAVCMLQPRGTSTARK